MSLPIAVLAGLDPVLQGAGIAGLVTDVPELVSVRHEVASGSDHLRRVIVDSFGVIEDGWTPIEQPCVTCAIREDSIATLQRLRDSGRWSSFSYTPPSGSTTLPFCTRFDAETNDGGLLSGLRLASVVAVIDVDSLEHDLLGDDLLADRDLALSEDDRRSVGEVVAAVLGHVDLVVTSGDDPVGLAFTDHVRADDGERVDTLSELPSTRLLQGRHSCRHASRRLDPRWVRANGRPTADLVWTLDLHSERPFHPERLWRNIDKLGQTRTRSRGRFWLPDRPSSVCAWDGAGAQLSIGDAGDWRECSPSTRLVFTGTGPERPALVRAFEESLTTPSELARPEADWAGASEMFAHFL